jgi:hypothetical protein
MAETHPDNLLQRSESLPPELSGSPNRMLTSNELALRALQRAFRTVIEEVGLPPIQNEEAAGQVIPLRRPTTEPHT